MGRFEATLLKEEEVKELRELARICRGDILKMTTLAKSGHPGGSMSSVDMYLVVWKYANISPKNVNDPNRDRIVVSHGHTAPGVYAVLGRLGFFDIDEVIAGFRHPGSIFEGHITRGIPGVEWTTGNLGQGLSAGVGMALAAKFTKRDYHVFVMMSDAEQAKGQVAEARRTAAKYGLDNITVVIDYNDAQISGKASEIMPVNIKEEYKAAGWEVKEVDGHNHAELYTTIKAAVEDSKPTVVIAKTTIGKGVSFMEDEVKYHGVPLKREEYEKAMDELGLEKDLSKYEELRSKLPVSHERPIPQDESIEINTGEPRTYEPGTKIDNRSAAGQAIADLVRANPDKPIYAVDCDLLGSVRLNILAKENPDRVVEIGVQEHNAATIAGAMSVSGVLAFFADFGVFGVDETYNQHRLNDINHTNLKVLITHVGTDVGEDGKTHHCVDYVGVLANLFHWHLIVPGDPNQTDRAIRYAATHKGNFTVAVGRSKLEVVLSEHGTPFFGNDYIFEYGKVDVVRRGETVTILTYGQLLYRAVKVADELRFQGKKVTVLNVSCPLHPDVETLRTWTHGKHVIVYEDHNVNTGLYNVFTKLCVENGIRPINVIPLGVKDYALSGEANILMKSTGISEEDLKKAIESVE